MSTMKRRVLDQRGLVSITATIVFIMVISLIVLGFSQVSRRNARQSLDRQLSAQASYAAESAINDAIYKIAKTLESGEALVEKPACDVTNDTTGYVNNKGNIQNAPGVKYTCLKVKAQLPTQDFDRVTGPVVINLDAKGGAQLESNTITWTRQAVKRPGASLDKCRDKASHPDGATWASECPFGILRVDIIPATPGAAGTLGNVQNATANTMTLFLYPKRGTNTAAIPYTAATANAFGNTVNQGLTVYGNCDDDTCSVTVNELKFLNAFMRVQSLYVPAENLEIAASSDDNTFENGQVEIDATGKAQDVLRRINVRYPILGSSRANVPNFTVYSLQSTASICKKFSVYPGSYSNKESSCN